MTRQTKISSGLVIGAIALGVLLIYAQPSGSKPTKDSTGSVQGVLSIDKTNHDFGTISMKNGNVNTVFKIKNTQSEPLKLRKLYTSCMCTQAALKLGSRIQGPFGMQGHGFIPTFDETLQPNEEAEIQVVFDPNAHGPAGVGMIERVVILEGEQGELANVKIKANVTP